MLRSAAALAALLIFPGIAAAQQEPADTVEEAHTVVRGECLWCLAEVYYEDGFEWRRIYEANDEKIDDPHWIYPGQEFLIPGFGRVVVGQGPVEEPPPEEPEEPAEPEEEPAGPPAAANVYPGPGDPTVFSDPPRENIPTPGDRTAFYGALTREEMESGGVLTGERVEHLEVPDHAFYSAPWHLPGVLRNQISYPGEVVGWAGAQAVEQRRETVNPYDRVEFRWTDGTPPAEGARIQMVRVQRSERGFGSVIRPTGLARVVERNDSGAVGIVLNAFTRPLVGDLALPADPMPVERGQYSEPTRDGLTATLVGFAVPRTVQQLGDIAFLDAGSSAGVAVGDVFSLEVSGGGGWSAQEAVRFQVVRVFEDRSSARVTAVTTPTFSPGSEVVRIRRMP